MGTLVTIHVVRDSLDADAAIGRAFTWFHEIEQRCSRFLDGSELRKLTAGAPVEVSTILFEAVQFALMVAEPKAMRAERWRRWSLGGVVV